MSRRQLMNSRVSQSMLFRLSSLSLAFFLVCLSVVGPTSAQAQTKRFTARALTLTPSGTISAAKETIPKPSAVLSGINIAPGKKTKRTLKPNAVTAVACDVTIAPGSSPAGGYLPLSGFGVPPVAGVGDDTITNFITPAYTFAGETYTQIGFASNGYAVVGPTTAADNSIANQNFPNLAPPNNVLAPFWTDLNPAAAGALRIATLTDGSDTWIVLDWEAVREFSTANSNSFQIWIGINGDANPAEDISYAYGTIQGNGDGGFLTVGAENKNGTRGQNYYYNGTGTLPANGTQLRVTTTSCVVTKGWTTAGSTGTTDEDSASIVSHNDFAVQLKDFMTGTVTVRYNITAVKGISTFCPATQSVVDVRFRNSDNTGVHAQVKFEIHRTNILSGGNNIIYSFNSNGLGAGGSFTSASTAPSIDFDFSTYIYWIEGTIFRDQTTQFADLGAIKIHESAGTTVCP